MSSQYSLGSPTYGRTLDPASTLDKVTETLPRSQGDSPTKSRVISHSSPSKIQPRDSLNTLPNSLSNSLPSNSKQLSSASSPPVRLRNPGSLSGRNNAVKHQSMFLPSMLHDDTSSLVSFLSSTKEESSDAGSDRETISSASLTETPGVVREIHSDNVSSDPEAFDPDLTAGSAAIPSDLDAENIGDTSDILRSAFSDYQHEINKLELQKTADSPIRNEQPDLSVLTTDDSSYDEVVTPISPFHPDLRSRFSSPTVGSKTEDEDEDVMKDVDDADDDDDTPIKNDLNKELTPSTVSETGKSPKKSHSDPNNSPSFGAAAIAAATSGRHYKPVAPAPSTSGHPSVATPPTPSKHKFQASPKGKFSAEHRFATEPLKDLPANSAAPQGSPSKNFRSAFDLMRPRHVLMAPRVSESDIRKIQVLQYPDLFIVDQVLSSLPPSTPTPDTVVYPGARYCSYAACFTQPVATATRSLRRSTLYFN